MSGENAQFRYSAFISYSSLDRRWATWLHRRLESYRIPKRLWGRSSPVGTIGARMPPVFRDRDELASSADLASSVNAALAEAATMIVICSPNAARSQWVNAEIRAFRALGRGDRINCLVVDGQPNASRVSGGSALREAFPAALFDDGANEPLAADLRPEADGPYAAKLKLLAGMLGVQYDELRQRDLARRARRLLIIAIAAAAGFVLMAALALTALLSRQQAIRQRDLARQKTVTAERTVDFVKSMFDVADPSEARGATITAREILDNANRRIVGSLNNEPAVKAELMTTLGEVYGDLGLLHQGDALIRRSMLLGGRDASTQIRQFAALGESQALQADFEASVNSFRAGLRAAAAAQPPQDDLVPRLLQGLSGSESALEQYPAAERAAQTSLQMTLQRFGPQAPEVAASLEALGFNEFYAGKLDQARARFVQAIGIREASQGALHPKVTEDLNALGVTAYMQHDSKNAEIYYRRVLANDQQVIGLDHPDVASTMISLARLLVERRDFAEAAVMLQHAVAVYVSQRGATNDDLAFGYDNLGLAERGLGHISVAEALFRQAIDVARLHHHRNLAPAMTDLADTLCANGAIADGLAMLPEARSIMAKDYPDDPWRVAWVDVVRGTCAWRLKRSADAAALVTASAPLIKQRWPVGSLYGAGLSHALALVGTRS